MDEDTLRFVQRADRLFVKRRVLLLGKHIRLVVAMHFPVLGFQDLEQVPQLHVSLHPRRRWVAIGVTEAEVHMVVVRYDADADLPAAVRAHGAHVGDGAGDGRHRDDLLDVLEGGDGAIAAHLRGFITPVGGHAAEKWRS